MNLFGTTSNFGGDDDVLTFEKIMQVKRDMESLMTPQFRVVTSHYLTVTRSRAWKRTWKHRLLTWPWRPWRRTLVITKTFPSKAFYVAEGDKIICHPAMANRLRESLPNKPYFPGVIAWPTTKP